MDARSLKRQIGAWMAHPLLARLFAPLTRNRATVFMLHNMADPARGISGHDPLLLAALLERLRVERHRIISLDQLFTALEEDGDLSGVCFTLDDGYLEQAEIAGPLFARYDVPATFFPISGFLDGKLLPWDMQAHCLLEKCRSGTVSLPMEGGDLTLDLSTPESLRLSRKHFISACKRLPAQQADAAVTLLAQTLDAELPTRPNERFRPMSWDAARALERQGCSFGPHSATHRVLARMNAGDVFREISESTRRLQEELARPLDIFCYPTGRYSDFGEREVCMLQQLGMRGAVSAERGYATVRGPNGRRSRFHLRRFPLPGTLHEAMHCCAGIERAKELVRAPLLWRG